MDSPIEPMPPAVVEARQALGVAKREAAEWRIKFNTLRDQALSDAKRAAADYRIAERRIERLTTSKKMAEQERDAAIERAEKAEAALAALKQKDGES